MKMRHAALVLASVSSLLLASPQAQAQAPANTTYKDIGLDCGGWFVGFAAHSSGRLYGYGDVFGVYRSDGATRGLSWTPLQNGFPKGDNFVMSVAVKTTDADTVAFTTDGPSVYKSTNGGASWTVGLPVVAYNSYNDSLPKDGRHYGSTELINSPVSGREREWWVARKRSGNNPATGQPWVGRLWRTDDDMATWQKMGGDMFDGDNKPITVYIHPSYPDHVWVGTVDMSTATTGGFGGLYVSTNRGGNFTKVWGTGKKGAVIDGKDKPYVHSIVRRASDGMAFLGSNVAGVIISSTNWNTPVQTTEGSNSTGTWKSWDAVPRYPGSGVGTTSVVLLPTGEFLSGKDIVGGVGSVVEKSSVSPASGQTWTTMSTILDPATPVPSWTKTPAANTNIPSYRSMITIDPLDSTRWYTTGGKSPMISTDSGATWKYPPIGNGLAAVNCYSATFPSGTAGANKVFISGADQGIFTFHDAGASGTPTSCSRRKVVDWDGSATTADDLHQTYHEVISSTNGEALVAAGVDQGANKNMIIKSTNSGLNWTRLNLDPVATGLPANGEGIVRATGKPSNVNDYVVVLGSGRNPSTPGVYRTTTGGATFQKTFDLTGVVTGGRTNFLGNTWITRAPDRENTVYLATGGSTSVTKGFRKSTDGGTTWLPLGTQPWGGNHSISGMSVDPAVPGRVWVAYDSTHNGNSNLLFRSDNYGDSWTPVNTYTYFNSANVARVTAANRQVAVWAKKLNDDGFRLYISKDDGANWSEATHGNMQTAGSKRYGHIANINMDPYRVGQIWLTGLTSVHVIDTNADATPSITSAATATGVSGSSFSYQITTSRTAAPGEPSTVTWTYAATPALPTGLTLNSSGLISGTLPTVSSSTTYNIDLTATAVHRTSAPKRLTITVTTSGNTPITLSNAGFESDQSQTPAGWLSSGTHLAADYAEAWNPRTGTNVLSHWLSGNPYQVYTYRTVTGLTNGTYTLKAWTISSGGLTTAKMKVKNYGGSEVFTSIPAGGSYTERVISNINVSNNQLELGFESASPGGADHWITVDDVSLTKN